MPNIAETGAISNDIKGFIKDKSMASVNNHTNWLSFLRKNISKKWEEKKIRKSGIVE